MPRTLIDIDGDLLARAAEVLGTSTKKSTVEAALRAAVSKQARRRLGEMMAAAGSAAELDDLRDAAWR